MSKKTLLTIVIALLGVSLIGTSIILLTNKPAKEEQKGSEEEKPKPINNPSGNFNVDVIKEMSIEENFLISPYSIEIALNMLKEGAKGNTYDEIQKVVGSRDIKDISSEDNISVANVVFIKNNYKDIIEDSFTKKLKTKYRSEVLYDDFNTPEVINNWVKEHTKGMIDKILDSISKDFVLGIANAVAIDVTWETEFECDHTRSAEFSKYDGTKMNVEMMHNTYGGEVYKYFETDSAKGVILPYKKVGKEQLEFIGILPNKDVKSYISSLTNKELETIDKNAKSASSNTKIDLSLPRFKYLYDAKTFMKNLENLGIKDAFSSSKANFRNIITEKNMSDSLYVSTAIHKAYIDLNEKGTKAAAVTYFGLDKNAVAERTNNFTVNFNKPFMYLIRDKETKDIIFAGTVYTPNVWNGSTCSESD